MSRMEGWAWTVLILGVVLAIPARLYHTLLLAVIVLLVLPVALLIFF